MRDCCTLYLHPFIITLAFHGDSRHILRLKHTYLYLMQSGLGGLYFPPRAAHTAHGEARRPAAADAAERRGVDGALLRATSVRAVQRPYLGDTRAVAHLVRLGFGFGFGFRFGFGFGFGVRVDLAGCHEGHRAAVAAPRARLRRNRYRHLACSPRRAVAVDALGQRAAIVHYRRRHAATLCVR